MLPFLGTGIKDNEISIEGLLTIISFDNKLHSKELTTHKTKYPIDQSFPNFVRHSQLM